MLHRIRKNGVQNLQITHAEFAIFLAQNSDVPSCKQHTQVKVHTQDNGITQITIGTGTAVLTLGSGTTSIA